MVFIEITIIMTYVISVLKYLRNGLGNMRFKVIWLTEDGLEIELNEFCCYNDALLFKHKLKTLGISSVIRTKNELDLEQYRDYYLSYQSNRGRG